MLARASILFSMKILKREQRVKVLAALVEGVGINATCRMNDVAKNKGFSVFDNSVGLFCIIF